LGLANENVLMELNIRKRVSFWLGQYSIYNNNVWMLRESCDTSVDKVALIARWLVIHTSKTISIYMIKCFCGLFILFTELGDNYVGISGSKTRYD